MKMPIRRKNPPVLPPAPFGKGGHWGIFRRCMKRGAAHFHLLCCADRFMSYFAGGILLPIQKSSGQTQIANMLDHLPACNARFAAASSFNLVSLTFGYFRSRSASASMTAAATATRVNHLLSAGTTYHGAALVAVLRIMSSYASM